MRYSFQQLFLATLSASLFFIACSKKGSGTEENPQDPAIAQLYKTIQGKWEFDVPTSLGRKEKQTSTSKRFSTFLLPVVDQSFVVKRGGDAVNGFIEFLSDSTFILSDEEMNVFTGRFTVKDGATISLAGFGEISEIKFTQNVINFIVSYSSPNKKITIKANKAAAITLDDKTKMLTRNWLLTDEKDGKEIYDEGIETNPDGNEMQPVDKVTLLLSSSGTYLVQFFYANKLISAEVANWKWHRTDANKFVYWWEEEPTSQEEDDFSITVVRLTNSLLETSERYETMPGEYEEDSYVFRAL